MLGRAAVLVALAFMILAVWWPSPMAVLHNNLGSLLLNRALLAPDTTPHEAVTAAMRAGASFQKALAWDPINGQTYYNLAAIYASWQDAPAAARALARAAALMPHDSVAQLKHGLALAERGQEARALEAWKAAGASIYFLHRGQALAGQGDLEGALKQYQRAVTIDPGRAEAHLRLGQALSRLGRGEEALAAFAAAAEADRGSSDRPHLLQAEIHLARGEWTAAVAAYRDAAALSPDDPEPHYRRGWLLTEKLGDDEAAAAAFQEALRLQPDHDPSRVALGRLEAERGACDAAEYWLDPLLRHPEDVEESAEREEQVSRLQVLLATCLVEQGRSSAALSHLEQAQALDPKDPSTLLRLGQTYSRAGRYQDAIDTYLRVLELAPDNQEARRALDELNWSETTEGK